MDEVKLTEPFVTVVTVVFNAVQDGRTEVLRRCLHSVQSQRGVAIEHLVIDGASQDGTLDVIRGFPGENWPIRLHSEPDHGIYEAMNRGIDRAAGRFIAFLNSDDFYHETSALAASVAELDKTGADFSYAPARVVDAAGHDVQHPFGEANPYGIFQGMTFCHQTMLVRRTVFEQLHGFDLRYRSAADYDFLLRMIFCGFRACKVPLSLVTFQTGGFSEKNSELSKREKVTIYRERYSSCSASPLSDQDAQSICKGLELSAGLALRLSVYGRATFGSAFRPGPSMLKWWEPHCDYFALHAASERMNDKGLRWLAFRHPRLALQILGNYIKAFVNGAVDNFSKFSYDYCEGWLRQSKSHFSAAETLKIQPDAYAIQSGVVLSRDFEGTIAVPPALLSRKLELTVMIRGGENPNLRFVRRTVSNREIRDGRVAFDVRVGGTGTKPDDSAVVFAGAYLL